MKMTSGSLPPAAALERYSARGISAMSQRLSGSRSPIFAAAMIFRTTLIGKVAAIGKAKGR
jgi:hypothetical protein